MAYISASDLNARLGATLYGRLTDRVNGTTPNSTVAGEICAEAEAEADSYLCRQYTTPVDLVAHPELATLLRSRVLDLAEFLAWQASPFVNDLPGRVRVLGDEARRWLQRVASGAVELPTGSTPAEDTPRYRSGRQGFATQELDGL
ncbi:MAG: DUF1320 family protein [Phycisphaerae bacterium]|jgi:phage gp36-like protein